MLDIRALSADKPEGNTGITLFTFEVTRTGSLTQAATVNWAVSGSGANPAGKDFYGVLQNRTAPVFPSGSLAFAAGDSVKTITVQVLGDYGKEPDETFSVTLAGASANETIGTAAAIGIIRSEAGDAAQDDRVVANASAPAYKAVVAIDSDTVNSLFNGVGSGIAIGANFVLTAGHVLKGSLGALITPAASVAALPARIIYGTVNAALTAVTPLFSTIAAQYNTAAPAFFPFGYNATNQPRDDIALQRTSTPVVANADALGMVVFLNGNDARGLAITTAGFPGTYSKAFDLDNGRDDALSNDNTARTLYVASGTVSSETDEGSGRAKIYYSATVDTQGGQSGSGVWINSLFGETRTLLLAIHNYGSNNVFLNAGAVNSGSLITPAAYKAIAAQMQADLGSTAPQVARDLPEDTIVGTDPGTGTGNDFIEGSFRFERIIGRGGNDRILGAGGDDRIEGGTGVDQALFGDALANYAITVADPAKAYFQIEHTAGSKADGKDSTKDVEFAVFEYVDANADGTDDDGKVLFVPLQIDAKHPTKLKDGPSIKPSVKVLDAKQTELGSFSAALPAWSFDGDIDYTLQIGSRTGLLYNVALIVDVSGSIAGTPLTQTKAAFQALIQSFKDRGIADKTQFAVIPFNDTATLYAPLTADQALTRINGLSAGGGTEFGPPLTKARDFFVAQPKLTNLAYFVSDGFGNGASDSLQVYANVQAFGLPGADTSGLDLIDTDNAVILNKPTDIVAAINSSTVDKKTIARVEIRLAGKLVDTITPDKLVDSGSGGLTFDGAISGLDVSRIAANAIDFVLVFNNGTPSVTLSSQVTTGQTEIVQQTNAGSAVVLLAVNQADYSPNATGTAQSLTLTANDLSNTITLAKAQNTIESLGGDDRIIVTAGATGIIDGGDGIDTAVFATTRAAAGALSTIGGVTQVGSQLSLVNVEFLDFTDIRVATVGLKDVRVARLGATTATITERAGGRTATFQLTLDAAATAPVTVVARIVGGTADATDFTAPTSSTVIVAGQRTATIAIAALDDSIAEGTETIQIELEVPADVQFADGSQRALLDVALSDDEVVLSAASTGFGTVLEGAPGAGGVLTVAVTRVGAADTALTLTYAVTGAGTDPAAPSDFLGGAFPTGQVSFAIGQALAELQINVAGDLLREPDKSFTVTFSSALPSVTAPDPLTFTILDDDQTVYAIAPVAAMQAEGASGATNYTFKVSRTGDSTAAATLSYAVTGSGTAAATAADFTGGILPAGTVAFAAGEIEKIVAISVQGDTAVEADEGFTITIGGASAISTATAIATILNDDSSFAIATLDARKAEGNAGATLLTFTVTRTGDLSTPASVAYAVAGSGTSAASAGDFTGAVLPVGAVAFAAGAASQTVTISVAGDTAVEPDETFTVTIAGPPNVTTATATATILNDDTAYAIVATDARKAEGNTSITLLTFTVTRTGDLPLGSIAYAVTGSGTNAAAADDFSGAALPKGTVDFAAGETSKIVAVQVAGDTRFEPDETFTITLSGQPNINTPTATGTILNDDQAGPALGIINQSKGTSSVLNLDPADPGGPSYLKWQYIYSGPDSLTMSTQAEDVFLHGGAGTDAMQVGSGHNVLDGGTGSNFMTGGTGIDTFFTDARGSAIVWNTIRGFGAGDAVTLWGFTPGVSSFSGQAPAQIGTALKPVWEQAGAAGFEGATLRTNIAGGNGRNGDKIDASVTFSGMSNAQAANLQLVLGEVAAGKYLYIYNPGV